LHSAKFRTRADFSSDNRYSPHKRRCISQKQPRNRRDELPHHKWRRKFFCTSARFSPRQNVLVNSTSFRLWVFLLFVLPCGAAADQCAFAQAIESPAAEVELLEDVDDGQLQRFEFVDAALIAGGMTDPRARAEMLRRRDEKYAAIDFAAIRKLPSQDRLTAALFALHSQILTGKFRPTATLVQQTLTTGDFNCVTATILFHDICSQAKVSVEIVAKSGHVCSRLVDADCEIETTRTTDLRRALESIEGRVTGRIISRSITPSELLGRIYYNRALAALEKKEFAAAIRLLQHSLTCDPQDHDAQENLLAGLNNWALSLCEQQDYAAAAERIATGLAVNKDYQPLRSNDLHVHQQWVAQLCREAEFARALHVLETGRTRRPDAPLFAGGQRAVYDAWLKHCVATGDSAKAAQVLHAAQQQLGPAANFTLEARPLPKVISAHKSPRGTGNSIQATSRGGQ
jgi:tetratricopeptide (TPR) repeat protein